jgi:hypothetical protein
MTPIPAFPQNPRSMDFGGRSNHLPHFSFFKKWGRQEGVEFANSIVFEPAIFYFFTDLPATFHFIPCLLAFLSPF